jgi:predicted acyl esterase
VRGSLRALDPKKSTRFEPVLSLRERDFRPMPAGRFVPVTIPLYYQGHAYRAGSRIRVVVSAPNGEQPVWAFAEAEPSGQANVAISYSPKHPSRLVLPVVPGVDVSAPLPPCPSLRNEPCRDYKPATNGG